MKIFKSIYQFYSPIQIIGNPWFQRTWPQFVPKKLDLVAILAALARLDQPWVGSERTLQYGFNFQFHRDQSNLEVERRLKSLLTDINSLDQIVGHDITMWMKELQPLHPTTWIYCGYSDGQLPLKISPHREQETILTKLLGPLPDRSRLVSQSLKLRNENRSGQTLLVHEAPGRFTPFRFEGQTLKARGRGRIPEESFHMGICALTLMSRPLEDDGETLNYEAYQFFPCQRLDLDLIIASTELVEGFISRNHMKDSAFYLWFEGEDSITTRYFLSAMLERGMVEFERVCAPFLAFGEHPIVSFIEFLAWSKKPRVWISFHPNEGEIKFGVVRV